MDTEATLAIDHARVNELEETLFQADFYIAQALECRTDYNRQAILRMTRETLRKGLNNAASYKLIDL
jgi:hypothetical protein